MTNMGMPTEYYIPKHMHGHILQNNYLIPYSMGGNRKVRVNRGTLQGDSLSPFMFTLLLEPLMQSLQVGSMGYALHYMRDDTANPSRRTYVGHAFADGISITTSTIAADMKL